MGASTQGRAESDVSDARAGRYLAHEMARRLDAGIAPEAGDVGGQAAQDQGHERHSCGMVKPLA